MKKLIWFLAALAVASCQSHEQDRDWNTREEEPYHEEIKKDPMDDFVGYFDIQRRNGDSSLHGYLEVFLNDGEVGYTTGPLVGSSTPAPRVRVSSPRSTTKVELRENVFTQTFEDDRRKVAVTYERVGAQLSVKSEACDENGCETDLWIAVKPD